MNQRLTYLFAFVLFLISSSISAQVVEEQRHMVMGQKNALVLDFADASSSDLNKEWKAYTSDVGKSRKVKKSKEYIIADAQILEIGGANRLDLYSMVEKVGKESSRIIIWVDTGEGIISSDSDPKAYAGSVKYLQGFAHHMKIVGVENELEIEKKEMDKLSKEMDKLERDNENYHKAIAKAKETIAKNEDNIVQNLKDQELTEKNIELQNELIKEIEERLSKIKTSDPGKKE